jgi:hypothetical protein
MPAARRMLTSDSIITHHRPLATVGGCFDQAYSPYSRTRRQRQDEAFARRLAEVRFQARQGAGA